MLRGWLRLLAVLPLGMGVAPTQAAPQGAPEVTSAPDDNAVAALDLGATIDPELVAEIDAIMPQLGAPRYDHREAATQRLIEIGPGAFSRLQKAYALADTLEVKLRLETIVHKAYLNFHVLNRNGFLGVGLNPYIRSRHQDLQVPEGTAGLVITSITTGTGAEKAGLKKKDVIIGLGGKPLEGTGMQARDAFAASVRSNRPGTTILLTVIRGADTQEIAATLGSPPSDTLGQSRILAIPDLVRATNDQFRPWWSAHFLNSAAQTDVDHGR